MQRKASQNKLLNTIKMEVQQQQFDFEQQQQFSDQNKQENYNKIPKNSTFNLSQNQTNTTIDSRINQKYDYKLTAEERAAIQRTVAEKFITIGYGYILNKAVIKRKHNKIITASLYNNMMTSVVRKVLRSLQNFLLKDCHQKITALSHEEGSRLRSPMIQCTKWMSKNEMQTFYKFILNTYNIREERISEDNACKLYGQLTKSGKKGHEVDFIILHREKKKQSSIQGLKFSYAPSSFVWTNR